MAKGSLRKRTKKMGRWIVNIVSMPYFWLAISIFIMMIIAAVISYVLNGKEETYSASIFANIFSGLITGLILLLVTGVKNCGKYKTQKLMEELQKVEEIIKKFRELEDNLYRIKEADSDSFENAALEAISAAKDITSVIIRLSFEESAKKNWNYDTKKSSDFCDEIHEYIENNVNEQEYRKNVRSYLRKYSNEITQLNKAILKELEKCKYKLHIMEKSLL